MTGEELRAARFAIGNAIGDKLSYLDMAALCGLQDPAGNGKDTIRKWEDGEGPSGPVAELVGLIVRGVQSASVGGYFEDHVRRVVGITD